MIKLRRIRAVARKEWLHVLRDPRSLLLALLIPVLLLSLFGWTLTLDVSNVPTIIWDQSGTPRSRELISRFDGSRYFSIIRYARDYGDVTQALNHGSAFVAVVVPRDFAECVDAGRDAKVQVILDGSDANTAQLALGYTRAVAAAHTVELVRLQAQRGQAAPAAPPIDARMRAWYNPDLRSQNFIIPGLIAFIMAVIAAMLTSLTVAKEWERGTMEQLISTPVRGPELIIGKLIPYWVIGIADVMIALIMGIFIFDVPFMGDALFFFAASAVFLVAVLSQGMMFGIIFKNQVLASQFAILSTFLPTLFLSGFVFSISNMPLPLRMVSYGISSRYFIEVLRAIFLKGNGISTMWFASLMLLVFALFFFGMANRRFRKKLS